ncbi:MAG TPA: ATP-binding protein, partial [Cellvibrio sp.]
TQLHSDFYPEVELHIAASAQAACLQGDTEYLAMLIHNLVQNALRYGSGRVQLSVVHSGNQLQLCVEDNGSGIPEAEREQVLKPFCRGTGSQHQGRGHGLGLAIVERIAQWHGATLLLSESSVLGGLKVTVIFDGEK